MVVILTPISVVNAQVRITPQDHPAHYILLIDASGSNVRTKAKAAGYRQAIDASVGRLFEGGFGSAVPAIDPRQDFVSVHTFGIVPNDVGGFAYEHLRGRNLFELVQPKLLWKRNATADEVARAASPDRFYALTLMVWAPHLALHAARVPDGATYAQKTYRVMVSDGLGNQGSLPAEEEMIRRWGTRDAIQRAARAVEEVQRAYRVRDGEETRWREMHGPSETPVYLEAAEVDVRDVLELDASGAEVKPFDVVDFEWNGDQDGNSTATVKAVPSSRLRGLLSRLRSNAWKLSITGVASGSGKGEALLSPLTASVIRKGRSPCYSETLQLNLQGAATYRDDLFGLRTLPVRSTTHMQTPLPPRCTAAWMAGWATTVGGALALVFAIAYAIYYGCFATHIAVFEPAATIGRRLRWDKPVQAGATLAPMKQGMPALIVTLKTNALIRALYYRRARVVLKTDPPGVLEWAHGSESVLLKDNQQIIARWTGAAELPREITIVLERGSRRAEYRIDSSNPPRESDHAQT